MNQELQVLFDRFACSTRMRHGHGENREKQKYESDRPAHSEPGHKLACGVRLVGRGRPRRRESLDGLSKLPRERPVRSGNPNERRSPHPHAKHHRLPPWRSSHAWHLKMLMDPREHSEAGNERQPGSHLNGHRQSSNETDTFAADGRGTCRIWQDQMASSEESKPEGAGEQMHNLDPKRHGNHSHSVAHRTYRTNAPGALAYFGIRKIST